MCGWWRGSNWNHRCKYSLVHCNIRSILCMIWFKESHHSIEYEASLTWIMLIHARTRGPAAFCCSEIYWHLNWSRISVRHWKCIGTTVSVFMIQWVIVTRQHVCIPVPFDNNVTGWLGLRININTNTLKISLLHLWAYSYALACHECLEQAKHHDRIFWS